MSEARAPGTAADRAVNSAVDVAAAESSGARATVIALVMLALAAVATEAASRFVGQHFADAVRARDAILELLPYASWMRYVTLGALGIGTLACLLYAARHAPAEIPRMAAIVATMYLLRAAFMVLTPLASPREEALYVFPVFANGMFPSGHTALAVLLARMIGPHSAPALRRVLWGLVVIVIGTLLLSRGHYSIDIVGGALLAYFVEREWTTGNLFAWPRRLIGGAWQTADSDARTGIGQP